MQSLQSADKVLGAVACTLLQPLRWWRALSRRRRAEPVEARRVLLIKFWGIGSLQLLTPAARSLRERHPQADFVLLTLCANAEGARAFGVFGRVLTLDVAGTGWVGIFARILRLVRELRRQRFDAVYDFEFFTRFSSVVTALTGAPSTHGYASPNVWRGGFHTRQVPFNRYWHVARNFRVLAGGSPDSVEPDELVPLAFDSADEERLGARLTALGLEPGRPYAVLNPNAGHLSLERRWPRSHFAALARWLEEQGIAPIVIGAASERAWSAGVVELAALDAERPSRTLNLAGELDLKELAALFAGADVVVSNDSGPMHLAAALGAPTLGLFGPETPVMYAPIGERTRSLYAPPPCSPCINVHDNKVATCIYGRPECLVNIDVGQVVAGVRELRSEILVLHPRQPASPAELSYPVSGS